VYNLHVQNKQGRAAVFSLTRADTEGDPPDLDVVIAQPTLRLDSLGDDVTPVIVTLPRAAWASPFPFHLSVTDSASGRQQDVELRFHGP
jgi:hypothetical protein